MKTISTLPRREGVREESSTFRASGGLPLFYRCWKPAVPDGRCVLLLHRGHEHSGRLGEIARVLCEGGATCFAYDARGHGKSPGRRGDAPDFATLVRDLDAFASHVGEAHGFPREQMAVVANSVAGVVAAAWVHDYAPRIRGLVLVAPAFSIKLYVPFALAGLRGLLRLKPDLFIKSYVRASFLTRDADEARRYGADRRITRDISARILVELDAVARRLVAGADAIVTPVLVLSAGADCVVRAGSQRAFHARLGAGLKRFTSHPEMRHALLHERGRAGVFAEIGDFLKEVFAMPLPSEDGLLDADLRGPSAEEYAALRRPAPPVPRAVFATQRLALQTAGRLSEGIRIGWRHGFDSGRSLDYVYENRASGTGWLGRQIDKAYLESPGWRGIRQRRELLEGVLRECLRERPDARIVDIACGEGRYVLDVLPDHPGASAFLSDWSEANVEAARAGAAKRGLAGVQCARGDAFDEVRLAALMPRADIVIVSGLYELFPDNARVLASLRGISRLLASGGSLIYTNQPTHPQLEMIARVLRNRDGEPWIMRRRSQAEMNALVHSVGMCKQRTTVDDQGIFTVSIAKKEGSK